MMGGAFMFFTEQEMKITEEFAWEMLEGWNHAYMPDRRNLARNSSIIPIDTALEDQPVEVGEKFHTSFLAG